MTAQSRPLVSAVLAVRNEERHIGAALSSLLQQDTPNFQLEIIVVDGDSSDRTREIIERISARDPRVRIAVNKQRKTPYAFNLGIQMARGEYVSIHGAHTTYAGNYISMCLEELEIHGAGGCSGREIVRPGGKGLQAQLIAWVLAHPFGTSTGSMRTRGAGFADTIPYPIFRKSTLLEVGGYDTQLHRNQDNDLSQRIRAKGHSLYITDRTSCDYFVSSGLVSLAKYAFNTGFWNIISYKRSPASMSMRHFVPGTFVVVLLLSLLTFWISINTTGYLEVGLRGPLILLTFAYGIASMAAACHILLKRRSASALLTPVIFLLLHLSYGSGSLLAIARNARPMSSKPNRGREAVEHT